MDNSRIGSTTPYGGIVREFKYASTACFSIVSYTCPSNGSLAVFFFFEASLSKYLVWDDWATLIYKIVKTV